MMLGLALLRADMVRSGRNLARRILRLILLLLITLAIIMACCIPLNVSITLFRIMAI